MKLYTLHAWLFIESMTSLNQSPTSYVTLQAYNEHLLMEPPYVASHPHHQNATHTSPIEHYYYGTSLSTSSCSLGSSGPAGLSAVCGPGVYDGGPGLRGAGGGQLDGIDVGASPADERYTGCMPSPIGNQHQARHPFHLHHHHQQHQQLHELQQQQTQQSNKRLKHSHVTSLSSRVGDADSCGGAVAGSYVKSPMTQQHQQQQQMMMQQDNYHNQADDVNGWSSDDVIAATADHQGSHIIRYNYNYVNIYIYGNLSDNGARINAFGQV